MKIGDKVKLRRRLYERGDLSRYPAGTILEIVGLGVGVYDWGCITESGLPILVTEDDIELCEDGDSQVVPFIKEGWLGRVFYTFDGEVLRLLPYVRRPSDASMPTMHDLIQPLTIKSNWLKELLGIMETKDGKAEEKSPAS